MDYNEEFIYDDSRIYQKLYVFLKFIGLLFYSMTLLTCYKPNFYIGMIVAMFFATMNSARYEYAHFKRYGTQFSSMIEYNTWKNELRPKSKIFCATIELSIKTMYFIKTFPPQCQFDNLCEIGESILKIHILFLFSVYIILGICLICILSMIYCGDCFNYRPTRRRKRASLQITINQNEECCICLDMDNTGDWSILQCGHKFHTRCVSAWIINHQTCPVCRFNLSSVS